MVLKVLFNRQVEVNQIFSVSSTGDTSLWIFCVNMFGGRTGSTLSSTNKKTSHVLHFVLTVQKRYLSRLEKGVSRRK